MDIQTKTRTDIAAEGLIQLILDNEMQPGDKLPNEYMLAETLGVGRNTMREAIRRLCSRNILVSRQGSGTFVSQKKGIPEDPLGLIFMENNPTDFQLAIELSDVRLMIEPEIAALAAARATDEQKEQLQRQCLAVERIMDEKEDYAQADMQFHRLIAQSSGNRVLINLMPIITSSIHACIVTTDDRYRNLAKDEHMDICRAICNGDSLSARYAMITHLSNSRRAYHTMAE